MNTISIFYSWQSDIDRKNNRNFIEDCLEKAIKNSSKEVNLLLNLDRDTKNTDGSPDIASTIFDKIDKCHLFVADITIINPTSENTRKTPNPNVLIELGYAGAKIGWDKIVCIFNSASGNIEDLPFDIKSRRISPYKLDDKSDKKLVKEQLVKVFGEVIKKIDLRKSQKDYEITLKFSKEPEHIRRIALEQKGSWEFELLGKLLENHFSELDNRLEEIEKGLVFGKKKRLTPSEYLDFMGDNFERISSTITALPEIFNNNFEEAVGKPGESGDAIKIKKLADIIFIALNELVEIELESKKLLLSRNTKRLNTLINGWAREFIEQFRILPIEFKKVYSNDYAEGSNVTITINIKPFASSGAITELLGEFRKNPFIFVHDDDDEI